MLLCCNLKNIELKSKNIEIIITQRTESLRIFLSVKKLPREQYGMGYFYYCVLLNFWRKEKRRCKFKFRQMIFSSAYKKISG